MHSKCNINSVIRKTKGKTGPLFKAYSQQVEAKANKRSKNKRITSKKIFTFVFPLVATRYH